MKVCYIDTETAGLELHHPIIQIGAVAVEDDKEVDSVNIRIAFDEASADPKALDINSYDPNVWKNEAVDIIEGYKTFFQFLNRHRDIIKQSQRGKLYDVAKVGGYNIVSFDVPKLRYEIGLASALEKGLRFWPVDFHFLDVYLLACWRDHIRPYILPNLKLQTLAAFYEIPALEAHDALDDARTTAKLAQRIVNDVRLLL